VLLGSDHPFDMGDPDPVATVRRAGLDSAAKAAILGLTRSAAKELIVQGVRVNAVAPGHVGTSTLEGEIDAERRAVAARTPAGRLADPDEIAGTVAFLASDDAGYFVGAVLSPNGGLVTA
jgi:3-oxoacyl-[acyl-carrier protein] reductase